MDADKPATPIVIVDPPGIVKSPLASKVDPPKLDEPTEIRATDAVMVEAVTVELVIP
jgi:hypothetical protein